MGTTYATSAGGPINTLSLSGAAGGNLPGLLVQDNLNQPQFIFIGVDGFPTTRITQDFAQWAIGFTDPTNTVIGSSTSATIDKTYDLREYVPIGNCMCWQNGILFMVAPDFNSIYRSVSGRPLDFMVNVTNLLTTGSSTPPGPTTIVDINGVTRTAYWQFGGGDATTTNYSVGVGNISAIRPIATGGILVCASNANFAVTLNTTPSAPTAFGEYTFIRTFLFNATAMSDRAILDTLGDTRFVELTGIRSFNAIEQVQNVGRNSVFSKTIQEALGSDDNPILQASQVSAAIYYNNYELYAINTLMGYVIAKYDSINNCWVSFDIQQTNGVAIKQFAKIELGVVKLYAVTVDNKLWQCYADPNKTIPYVRTIGLCSTIMWAGTPIVMAHPKIEVKLQKIRAVFNRITQNESVVMTAYCNNRMVIMDSLTKVITYEPSDNPTTDPLALPDVDTMLVNCMWASPDNEQGWKYFLTFTWQNGDLIQYAVAMDEMTPLNPAFAQGVTQ